MDSGYLHPATSSRRPKDSPLQILNTNSASGSYLIAAFELLEPPDSGLYQVMRVVRSEAFSQYILNPDSLKDSPHGTAGDDPGTLSGRFQQYATGTKSSNSSVCWIEARKAASSSIISTFMKCV